MKKKIIENGRTVTIHVSKKKAAKEQDMDEILENIFGEASDKIIKMMDTSEFDGAMVLTKKAMLKSSISLLPALEEAARDKPGTSTVYPYTTLIGTIQGLLEDIENMQDASLIADSINGNLVAPSFLSIAQFTVDSIYRLRSELKDYVNPSDRKVVGKMVNDTAAGIAQYLDVQKRELGDKITQRIVDV